MSLAGSPRSDVPGVPYLTCPVGCPTMQLIATRKRSLEQGNVFTPHLCDILFTGEGVCPTPLWKQTPPGLGKLLWLQTPQGWADPPDADPLRVGRPPQGWQTPLDGDHPGLGKPLPCRPPGVG